ncbi:MAG: cation diffusion facilitator family transporter [Bacteroidales bacterium]|nr:cation diffusion facilitator family transporter [Bacteroidales bacterium]
MKSILFAFAANIGIAITKTVAAVLTGSGAMLAEAIHSYADSGNQILLFAGIRASKRKPNAEHPLGYGKSTFFWSFVVALILFSVGGLFSVYEGIHKLESHEGLQSPYIAIIVLSVSILLESASLYGCVTQIRKVKRKDESIIKWFSHSRQSELVVVLGEDVAALLGLMFALAAVILTIVTGNPVFDAIGSIGIGVLLVVVSMFLAVKIKGLLIGQSAEKETVDALKTFIEAQPQVETLISIITQQLGPEIMLAVKVKMQNTDSGTAQANQINDCEKAIRKAFPDVKWIFFEPDIED